MMSNFIKAKGQICGQAAADFEELIYGN